MKRKVNDRKGSSNLGHSVAVPIGVIAALVICVILYNVIGTRAPEVDERLCPKKTGPIGATVLLLDSSDPLTPKHRAELERLASQITSKEKSGLGIAPGELLAVYEMTEDPGNPTTLFEKCRPFKNPRDRTWRDDIHQGRRFAERDWSRFEEVLTSVFPKVRDESQPVSPLLETISVLSARHTPGKRGDQQFKVHLIVFSDLLQNSDRLSHYGNYPEAQEIQHLARDLLTDLTGTRVSLFRLERPEYTQWQTDSHYYWWTEVVQVQGGQIEWQESI